MYATFDTLLRQDRIFVIEEVYEGKWIRIYYSPIDNPNPRIELLQSNWFNRTELDRRKLCKSDIYLPD